MDIVTLCIYFSSISFFVYGISYFTTDHMKNEFKRFGLERFALLTIILEFLGAAGLLIGLFFSPILLISSGGLSLLMFLGVMVRIKIKDSIRVTLPAILFMVFNFYIFLSAIENMKV